MNPNTDLEIDLYDDVSNPLDGLEEIMLRNDWTFDRRNEDELTVHISGKMGHYKMAFIWEDDYSAMKFCCAPDLSIAPSKLAETIQVMNKINTDLWLGHFDIRSNDNTATNTEAGSHIPCFRHTSLFRGAFESSGVEHMEDLVDIALAECERYYMTFDLLSKSSHQDNKALSLAMMDVAGQS